MNTLSATATKTTSSKTKQTNTPKQNISMMNDRQCVLAEVYRLTPDQAWVTDVAITGKGQTHIKDPLHADVEVAGVNILLGVHPAVGGDGDAPVPGELLSAALASCMDSTIRIIANRLSIELTHLQVAASAEADVRGTLKLKHSIPVGFQKMHLSVDLETKAGTKSQMIKTLLSAAEASCVVLQTLKHPPEITTQINVIDH